MTSITELALLVSKAKASVFTLEYISQFEPADIDSDDVDLRFEVDGRDTGTNVSIVDECGQAAKVIGTLVEALEKAQTKAIEQGRTACELFDEVTALRQRIAELEFIRTSADKVQREFAAELGCAGDNESILQAIEDLKVQSNTSLELRQAALADNAHLKLELGVLEHLRTAYMEWSNKTDWMQGDKRFDVVRPLGKHRADVLKAYIDHLESRTVTIEPFRSFVTDADLAALHRFAECCDDPESGGHDLEKEQVRRLESIGALQRSGRISYITGFGDVLISITAGIKVEAE